LPQIKHMRACLKDPNIRHDGTLLIGNFMLMIKNPKNLVFEPVHPKNVLIFIFCGKFKLKEV
jgi:hypothetical protein